MEFNNITGLKEDYALNRISEYNHDTGIISYNPTLLAELNPLAQDFVICHEAAHANGVFNPDWMYSEHKEIMCDIFAVEHLLEKKFYPDQILEAVKSISGISESRVEAVKIFLFSSGLTKRREALVWNEIYAAMGGVEVYNALDNAIKSSITEKVKQLSNGASLMSDRTLQSYARGIGKDYAKQTIITNVTSEDVQQIANNIVSQNQPGGGIWIAGGAVLILFIIVVIIIILKRKNKI